MDIKCYISLYNHRSISSLDQPNSNPQSLPGVWVSWLTTSWPLRFSWPLLPGRVDLPWTASGRLDPTCQSNTTPGIQALVISHIDYCSSLLAGLPACTFKPLQMIQNAALVSNQPQKQSLLCSDPSTGSRGQVSINGLTTMKCLLWGLTSSHMNTVGLIGSTRVSALQFNPVYVIQDCLGTPVCRNIQTHHHKVGMSVKGRLVGTHRTHVTFTFLEVRGVQNVPKM